MAPKFCPKCGAPVGSSVDRFCASCGGTFDAPPAAPPPLAPVAPSPSSYASPAPPTPRSSAAPWILLAVVLLVLGVGGGGAAAWWWMNRKPVPEPTPTPGPVVTPNPTPGPAPIPGPRPGPTPTPAPPPPAPSNRDFVDDARGASVGLPFGTLQEGEAIRIETVDDPPPPPEGLQPAGAMYQVDLPARIAGQEVAAFVRLPLPDPSVAEDPTKAVYIGRHTGTEWEILPAEVADGHAVAFVSHFSGLMTFTGIRRDRPDPSELASLRIGAPQFWGFEVGANVHMLLDISACRTATTGATFSRSIAVSRLNLYCSRPEGNDPGPRRTNLAPYRWLEGGDPQSLSTNWGTRLVPLGPFSDAAMGVTADTTTGYNRGRWMFAVRPVFADGSEGPMSDPVQVPVGVAEAFHKLYDGLESRIGAGSVDAFRTAAIAARMYVFPWATSGREAYFGAGGSARTRFQSAFWTGIEMRSFFEMSETSEFGRVLSHEWGHWVTNVVYGDAAFQAFPGGDHVGWREADSRELAMSEDLASFFGQMGAGRGYPAAAGPARGRMTQYCFQPETPGSNVWPTNQNMDAPRVETVPGTILGRLSHPRVYGFERVYTFLRDRRPMNILRMFDEWTGPGDTNPPDLARFQRVYRDCGVTWGVAGRVVGEPEEEGGEPEPIEGAAVWLRTLDDKDVAMTPATTDDDGRFGLRVPPGLIEYRIRIRGWAPSKRYRFAPATDGPTNGEPQVIEEEFLMRRVRPPEVTISAPANAAVVTENVVRVTGRVEGTQDGLPDGRPIARAVLYVNSERFNIQVTNGEFSQEALLSPGPVTLRVVAENEAGTGEASVSITANIRACVLKVILTWAGAGTDVDLWVTDPGGVTTGYQNRTPAEGRELDIDDTDGYGPETYTMSLPVRGTYNIRINYYRGEGGESFRVRYVVWERTPQEQRGQFGGGLSGADHNGSTPSANRSFTVTVP